jgi:hypothetical protein
MVLEQPGAVGGGAWVSEGWRVAAQGDRRCGIAPDWCGDWLVVALRKRNMKSVGWPTLLVPSQPTGIKSVTLVYVPTLLS